MPSCDLTDYPINLKLAGRSCLVIGGGSVAERKIAVLLGAGAVVTIISPNLTPRLALWASKGKLLHRSQPYGKGDAVGYSLVFCATGSSNVNERAALEAKQAGAWVNVADNPDLCDFTLPAQLRRGDLSMTVSTGGNSPALARELRNELAAQYGPEYAEYLEIVGRLRREWQTSCDSAGERCRRWNEMKGFDPDVLDLLRKGRKEEAEGRFRNGIGCFGAQS